MTHWILFAVIRIERNNNHRLSWGKAAIEVTMLECTNATWRIGFTSTISMRILIASVIFTKLNTSNAVGGNRSGPKVEKNL